MDPHEELKKVRQEAAKYRTQLSPFKKAFEGLDDEATQWMLDTVQMIRSNSQEAGARFASLAYGNLGEDGFTAYAKNVLGDEILPAQQAPNTDGVNAMDDQKFAEWTQQFEQKMMQAFQTQAQQMQQHFDVKMEEVNQRQEYDRITSVIKGMGYDPETWQGKLLIQVASDEAEGDDPVTRLQNANVIVRERIGDAAPNPTSEAASGVGSASDGDSLPGGSPSPEQQYQMVGGVRVPVAPTGTTQPAPASVPATGGDFGGTGVANGASEEPNTFNQADDALMALLNSSPGQ